MVLYAGSRSESDLIRKPESVINKFLNQHVPKAGKDMPAYYERALIVSEVLLAVFFAATFFLVGWTAGKWLPLPLVMLAAVLACLWAHRRVNALISVYAHEATLVIFCCWHIITFGWACGGQFLLIPALMFCFFNIYDRPWMKIITFLALVGLRMGMFAYSIDHAPLIPLSQSSLIVVQTITSLYTFVVLAVSFAHFSSNLQATERQLRLDNQKLSKEADTDPLTGLPNRRSMLQLLEDTPSDIYSIAIADIDFFKNINDTYGHSCGDYTLKELASLFLSYAPDRYSVCRWGGEEFCFYLPEKNLDEAGVVMFSIQQAVKKLRLEYEGNEFSITITIGVAENDFRSTTAAILEQADQKLYRGKMNGRDQVVL